MYLADSERWIHPIELHDDFNAFIEQVSARSATGGRLHKKWRLCECVEISFDFVAVGGCLEIEGRKEFGMSPVDSAYTPPNRTLLNTPISTSVISLLVAASVDAIIRT